MTKTPDDASQQATTLLVEQPSDELLRLVVAGRLDAQGAALVWDEAVKTALAAPVKTLAVDLGQTDLVDGAGAALVERLHRIAQTRNLGWEFTPPPPAFIPLVKLVLEKDLSKAASPPPTPKFIPELGRKGRLVFDDFKGLVAFIGEGATALHYVLKHPKALRKRDLLNICVSAGVNAMPIISVIGMLLGLVVAFQSAVPMQRFGADLYVADLLGISIIRELGPLVTSILLCGRSGSAFAAELGTMKVNEEINALITMNLDPVRFLAAPRMLAAMIVTPILTLFFNLCALIGGAFVVMSFGYPLVTYMTRVRTFVTEGDLLQGLFKSMVFAVLVAGIGCKRGLYAGTGAGGVGDATTSAVVTGLLFIAIADGVLAVLFYALKI